jgi:hypothetical protein
VPPSRCELGKAARRGRSYFFHAASLSRFVPYSFTSFILIRTSFDDKTPTLAGGLQYQLRLGTTLVVFANSFTSTIPPECLLQGNPDELLQRVEALRDSLSRMSSDQLKVNEIGEDDRRVQLELYEKLGASLGTPK